MKPVEGIAAESERILAVAREADLAAPVPALGRWKVRDVVAHLGGVHRWADRIVTARSMDGPGFRKSKLDGDELLAWFEAGAESLVATLGGVAPDEPCPNFNPGSPNTVEFWVRRQLSETTVHRWDVESAVEATTPIGDEVAADAVGEFLDTFVRTRGKQTATGPLVLATDEPRCHWTITLADKPGRVDVTVDGELLDTRLEGDASELLLLLWNRFELDETTLRVVGDEPTVRAFLAGA